MDRYLPRPDALRYTDRLTRLTKIRAYVRAQFLREDANVDWSDVNNKVNHLIDSRIDAQVRHLMTPISIFDQQFSEKVKALPHDEARASVMKHAIRAQIKESIAENPAFYERLSVHLARIIEDMRRKVIAAAEACRRLVALREEVLGEADVANQLGFSPMSFALYELMDQPVVEAKHSDNGSGEIREEKIPYRTTINETKKAVAQSIEGIVQHYQKIVDWQSREDVLRSMRRDIKRELRPLGDLTETESDEMVRTMVEVARRRLVRWPSEAP